MKSELVLPTEPELLEAIHGLCPLWQADEISDFEFLSGGYSNLNFKFSRLSFTGQSQHVLRIAGAAQPFVDRALEHQWYKSLPNGLWVKPDTHSIVSGAMITPWVQGTLLVEYFQSNSDPQQLIHFVRNLHAQLPTAPRCYDLPERLEQYGAAQSEIAKLGPIEQTQTCHNDLNPWNIIISEHGWVTLDWEFVARNDPLFDLLAIGLGLELEHLVVADMAWTYLGHRDPERLYNLIQGFYLREWSWAIYQIRAGNDRDEVVEQADSARKMLDKLASQGPSLLV